MQNQQKILIVDDEEKIVEVIDAYLTKSGYKTYRSYNGNEAIELFEKKNPDLVILDLMLPGKSGEEVCRQIRRLSRIPVIMLTAKVTESDKISGLDIGADDYITKPFSPRELVARVNAILRRCSDGLSPLFNTMSWNDNDLEIDTDRCRVIKTGETVNLTPSEFKILLALIKYPKKIFSREELITLVFGAEFDGYDRTIDSHIKNLRKKIETDTNNPQYIITVRGTGYRFGC